MGNLYGTSFAGGLYGEGAVFELSPQSQPGQLHDLRQRQAKGLDDRARIYRPRHQRRPCRRPALDELLADAHQGKFDVVAVWACDRLARSVRPFLATVDQLNHMNIDFVSCREQPDTGGPVGRAVVTIISAMVSSQ